MNYLSENWRQRISGAGAS
jgi:hypothetical protein